MPRQTPEQAKGPHPVDVHVGQRARGQRLLQGLSQTAMAGRLGLTFQQLQKYESGANRISASRLWQIAETLETPVAWFYEGIREGGDARDSETGTAHATLEMAPFHRTLSEAGPGPSAGADQSDRRGPRPGSAAGGGMTAAPA